MAGGVHGRRHAWQEACMAGGVHGRGACMVGGMHGRYYDIWSMSGWYAFYWNAFLFTFRFRRFLWGGGPKFSRFHAVFREFEKMVRSRLPRKSLGSAPTKLVNSRYF